MIKAWRYRFTGIRPRSGEEGTLSGRQSGPRFRQGSKVASDRLISDTVAKRGLLARIIATIAKADLEKP